MDPEEKIEALTQESRDSEARFEAVFEQSAVGIVLSAPDGRWLRANRKLGNILGYDEDELTQLCFRSIIHAEDIDAHLGLLAQLESGDIPVCEDEIRLLLKDGSTTWGFVTTSLVRDTQGQPDYFVTVVENIWRRRQTQAALNATEEKFRAVVGYFPAAIFFKDAQGRYTQVNKIFEEWYKVKEQDCLGATPADYFAEREAEFYAERDRLILREQKLINEERLVQYPDGKLRSTIIIKFPVLDGAGNSVGIGAINIDNTERKRAEDVLTQSEERLKEATVLAGLGHCLWDAIQDRCLYCSEEHAQTHGLSVEAYMNNAAEIDEEFSMVHPEDREKIHDLYKGLRKGAGFEVEYRVVAPSGEIRHVHEITKPIVDENGTVIQEYMTSHDVTERKRAEEALREARDELEVRVKERTVELRASEARLTQIADVSSDWIWEMDEALRFSYFSPGFKRLTGIDPEFSLGKTRQEISRDIVDDPAWRSHLEALAAHREFRHFEYEFIGPDGEPRIFDVSGSPTFGDRGDFMGYCGVCTDVTARKQEEEKLRIAMQEADAASRAKSEFLSRMSHELRTPMNAILGFAQLLQGSPPKQLEKQQQFVAHILDAGQHLLTLIDEVLDLARIESGRTQMFLEAVHPGEVLEECTKLTQLLVEKSSVRLENRVALSGAPAVWADRTRLKQVLLNLITNAVKYNRAEGRVTLSCEELRAGMLRISVSDTGLGIPEARIGELYEPFSRLHAEQSEVEGTGIGLTITKRLVKMMGGKLGVESTLGEGSTFWVELGLDPSGARVHGSGKTERAFAEAHPVDTDPRRRLALYIEDDPASLALMGEALKRQLGAVLLDAPTAELGLALARSERPDVILMDINLPGMDGYGALRALKADEATRAIPVIAVSANAIPKEIERGRQAGFLDYITKPIDLKRLDDALDRALREDT